MNVLKRIFHIHNYYATGDIETKIVGIYQIKTSKIKCEICGKEKKEIISLMVRRELLK